MTIDARRFLTAADHEALSARVREIEQRTGAEIVVVIASASGRYDRAESIVGVLGALCALAGADALAHAEGALGAPLWAQGAAVALGFVGGVALASAIGVLRRMFVMDVELDDEVRKAALSVYAEQQIGETTHGAGLLLYVSLFERRLEVVLDTAAAAAAGEGLAQRLSEAVGAALARGERRAAVEALLEEAGRALAGKLPPRATAGELADAIVVVHPHP